MHILMTVFAIMAAVAALATGDPDTILMASGGLAAADEETLKDVRSKLKRILDPDDGLMKQINEAVDSASDAKRKVNEISKDISEKIDEIKEASEKKRQSLKQEIHERLDDLEMAGSGSPSGKSLKQVVHSAMKSSPIGGELDATARAGAGTKVNFNGYGVKAIFDAPGADAQGITPTETQDEIVTSVRRTPTVVDLLPTEPVTSGSIEFIQEQATANQAGSQGDQGTALPEQNYEFDMVTFPIVTIGHTVPVAMQLLDDVTRLESVVRRLMRTDLQNKVDRKVLTDDGTSGQLDGLVPNSRQYNNNLENEIVDSGGNATVTDLDRIMVAITQLTRDDYTPTGIILPALNWSAIQLIKDNDGQYIFVQPQSETSPRLFGLPVAATNALDEGDAHVGAYEEAAQIADREESGVQVSTENNDNFEKLVATLRTYVRMQVQIRRPNGLVSIEGELDAQSPATGS